MDEWIGWVGRLQRLLQLHTVHERLAEQQYAPCTCKDYLSDGNRSIDMMDARNDWRSDGRDGSWDGMEELASNNPRLLLLTTGHRLLASS